jgi:hypothetical protein
MAGAMTIPINASAIKRSCIELFSLQRYLQFACKQMINGIKESLNTTKTQLHAQLVPWASPTEVVDVTADSGWAEETDRGNYFNWI